MTSCVRVLLVVMVLLLGSGCVVGPDYVRPVVVAPEAYKEQDGWKIARPQDDVFRGPWWERFGDPTLNTLEARVSAANLNLVVAEATYRQARALVREARSAYFPTATLGVGYTRSHSSENLGSLSGTTGAGAQNSTGARSGSSGSNFFQLPLDIAWEPDFWGKVRRSVESGQASAQASAGDLETARLSFSAELAQDYFQLRTLDAQKQLLDATVAAFEQSLTLTRTRHSAGVASQVDVAQAEAQLKSAQAQDLDVGVLRAQLEHAIALLVGQPPANFSLPASPLATGAAEHPRRRAVGAAAAPAGRRGRRAARGGRQRPDRCGHRRVLSHDHAERVGRLRELRHRDVADVAEPLLGRSARGSRRRCSTAGCGVRRPTPRARRTTPAWPPTARPCWARSRAWRTTWPRCASCRTRRACRTRRWRRRGSRSR